MSSNLLWNYLVERWRSTLLRSDIYPYFPFRKPSWRALAFNRDTSGNLRLPASVWQSFLGELSGRTNEASAFVVSPIPILAGSVSEREQPFVVPLTYQGVTAHFTDMNLYLPEFIMVGGSEQWAIWGDSDMTLLGAEESIIRPLIDEMGGDVAAVATMARDFGLDLEPHNSKMVKYLNALVKDQGH